MLCCIGCFDLVQLWYVISCVHMGAMLQSVAKESICCCLHYLLMLFTSFFSIAYVVTYLSRTVVIDGEFVAYIIIFVAWACLRCCNIFG